MLSIAFVNLEIEKKKKNKFLQIVQSRICDPGRKTRRKIKKSLGPAHSLAFRLVSFSQLL